VNVIILTGPGVGFPNGLASTVRVASLARGLTEQGCLVRLLCLGPSEDPGMGVRNQGVRGNEDGVDFEYTCGRTVRGGTVFEQAWLVLKGLALGAFRVLQLRRAGRVDALLVSSDKWAVIPLFWMVAGLCGAAYLCELSEEPFHQLEQGGVLGALCAICTYTLFRAYDGAIVISGRLEDYLRARMRPGAGLLRIPILMDAQLFARGGGPRRIEGEYVAFCGTLNEEKDGVLTLVKAFAMICADFPGLRLVLIGDSPKVSRIPMVRALAEELGIAERVVFTGVVSRGELPEYLDPATVLALARPSSRQASAGMPTKVGEYLATGRPVVVTRTGEIGDYLEDGVNVYFAAPDDVAAFAARLRHVLQHPEEAARVGRGGREVACTSFDFRANGLRIREFIERFHARRGSPPVVQGSPPRS
jgi:glycosyltransferase involved in cell wall biosynthesis